MVNHDSGVTIMKLTEGVNIVPIYFTGSNIRKMKVNGPYKVNVRMFGTSSKALDEGDFYTSRYKYRQFSGQLFFLYSFYLFVVVNHHNP